MNWRTCILLVLVQPLMCLAGPTTQPLKLDLDAGNVTEYDGDLGEKLPIGMTLRFADNGKTVSGSYFYYKYCKDIRIDGRIDGRNILIREFDPNGNQTGEFTGEFAASDPRHHYKEGEALQAEVMVGYWSKPDGSKRQPFYLSATYGGGWAQGERYESAGFDDENAVDEFMARFRQAVLDGNTHRVADMISYPIKVEISGKRIEIETAKQLLHRYDEIFRADYVERLRLAAPFHMFARDQGVMLGQGEVWVAPLERNGRTVPIVIAINNDIR